MLLTDHLFKVQYFTENDPRAPNPDGFKGNLYPPQATLLYAMCKFENHPSLTIHYNNPNHTGRIYVDNQLNLTSNRGVLSEKTSFGKTVLALALVCANQLPKKIPGAHGH